MAKTNAGDRNFQFLLRAMSWLIVALFLGMFLFLLQLAWPAVIQFGAKFFLQDDWNPPVDIFGAMPFLVGTLASSLLATMIAVPVSIATAIFLREIAPRRIATLVGFLIELLAAIPSVVYGLWGVLVLAPLVRDKIQPFLSEWLGPSSLFATLLSHLLTIVFFPVYILLESAQLTDASLSHFHEKMSNFALGLFNGPPVGLGVLTASLVLSIMITPTITSITREVFKTVPDPVREGALGLGATRWEMIRIAVLRSSRAGIIGAAILGLGRAIGETMAVTMVIGNRNEIPHALFEPAQTMASVIANEYNESDGIHQASLAYVGLGLFVVALFVNLGARTLVKWLDRGWNR